MLKFMLVLVFIGGSGKTSQQIGPYQSIEDCRQAESHAALEYEEKTGNKHGLITMCVEAPKEGMNVSS